MTESALSENLSSSSWLENTMFIFSISKPACYLESSSDAHCGCSHCENESRLCACDVFKCVCVQMVLEPIRGRKVEREPLEHN